MFKSDLLKVNGFDERYLAPAIGEDTDLEARLKRIGIKVRVCKHAVTVFHKNHKREEIPNNNGEILQYNKEHNISYTPWGINQDTLR
jgi:GT2 family glycosyltransferase